MDEACSRQSREILQDFRGFFDRNTLNRIENGNINRIDLIYKSIDYNFVTEELI